MVDEKTYNQIIKGGIALTLVLMLYLGYKAYEVWKDAKDTADDVVEGAKEKLEASWAWVLEGTDSAKDFIDDTKDAAKDLVEDVKSGKMEEKFKAEIKTGIVTGVKSSPESAIKSIYGQFGVDYLKWSYDVGEKTGTKIGTSIREKYDENISTAKTALNKLKFW